MNVRAIAAAACLALAFADLATAQPRITGLSAPQPARSQRLVIFGTAFGEQEGRVTIAGLDAWTTTWSDARIVAYVPETAPIGPATMIVTAGGQPSNPRDLTVTDRHSDGRARWRFEAEGDNMWWRPALAPDGTIYVHTNNVTEGIVYALSPNGGLKWVRKVNWVPDVPPTAGPDGAVYVGSIGSFYRISPEGQIDWRLDSQGVQASAHAGPDGRVYGSFDPGIGAFGVDAISGRLDWSNQGDPRISAWGMRSGDTVFGRSRRGGPVDRFYLCMDALWAFSLDGEQLWVSGTANAQQHEPAIGADGVIYAPGYLERYLVAFDPEDGSILWQTNDPWRANITDIEIGADDTLYFVSDGRWAHAFDPHSQSTIWRSEADSWLGRPSLSPDSSTLVTTGGGYQDRIGFVKAFDTSDGTERFNLDLQESWNPNFRHVPVHHPSISADSQTAYVPTFTAQWPTHDGDPRSWLYAIDISDGGGISCEAISSFKAKCRRGTLKAAVKSSLDEGTILAIDKDGEQKSMRIKRSGKGKVKFNGQSGQPVVRIVECPDEERVADCD